MKLTELEEGKVYLRDTRNGNFHPYEHLLAQMSYMNKFIAGKAGEEVPVDLRPQPPMAYLTPQERAKEYDRLAVMPNKERAAELKKQEDARQAQEVVDVTPIPTTKKRYAMTPKTDGATFKSFTDVGWSVEVMIREGMLVEITDLTVKADFEL